MPLNEVVDYVQIREYVRRLDELIPSNGAMVRESFKPTPGAECGGAITLIQGNRLGYLRLGIGFLRAAFMKYSSSSCTVEPGFCGIKGLEHNNYSFERHEVLPEPEQETVTVSRWEQISTYIGVLSFLLFALASCVVGAVTILRWVTGF